MKLVVPVLIGLLFSFTAIAQYKHCYTTEVYNKLIQQHPEVLQVQAQLEAFTKQYTANQKESRTASTIYIIPIVFHIIHNYGPEDISDAQVLDEVRILNLDYRNIDSDTGDVIPLYKPIAADCDIEFRLANKDPNGNCTNGIDRVVSPLTYNADDNSKLDPWPANKYLNVWVVSSLSEAGAAAYAYLPGTAPGNIDGVIVLHNYVGSIGTANPITSRTVTHEIGHFFNLYHPWGPTNSPGVSCGDDYVDDTPETAGWDYCDLSGLDCIGTVDNVQNYMEYSFCSNMFTQGQKTRMLAAMNSFTSGRNNLWTTANAIATGINNLVPNACAPKADFLNSPTLVCSEMPVQYSNLSWNGQPTSWNWNFPGGTPSTSTDSMPVVHYNTPGNYNATLTVSNASGSNSITKNSSIYVSGSPENSAPYYQSFETASSFPGSDGIVISPDNGVAWVRTTNAGSSGTASIMIRNYSGNSSGQIDSYVFPAVNISHITQSTLTFKVANAQHNANSADRLRVYISTNCGSSWYLKYSKSGAALATAGVVGSNFVPNSSQWRLETINLATFTGTSNLRIKFENTSDTGNNTYIDEVNITGVVGLDELNPASLNFDIYPNPSHGESTINFDLLKEGNAQIHILDIMGREVNQLADSRLNAGSHQFNINNDNFAKGIYFVELIVDGNRAVRKWMVE